MIDVENYFKKSELLPAIVQEKDTGEVLMLAYMNRESLKKTFETGYTWFYSRSRQELWNKGATSGHVQKVVDIKGDCDEDTLLITVIQTGAACHTGALEGLYQVVQERKGEKREGSYTCYLFEQGLDKILKKCGEECSEVIIAAKNGKNEDTANEICDLIYHLLVMMVESGIPLEDVEKILAERRQKIGNLKKFHVSDHNT